MAARSVRKPNRPAFWARASRYSLEDLRDQVRLETETAFFNLQNSVANLSAATQALTSARTSLDATREGYRVGVRSIIDLLTVVQDFTTAERNYFTALYDHVIARVRLKAAVGVLAVEDLESINSLLRLRMTKLPITLKGTAEWVKRTC